MLTNPPVPYDFYVGVQPGEGPSSVIVKTGCGTDGAFYSTTQDEVKYHGH